MRPRSTWPFHEALPLRRIWEASLWSAGETVCDGDHKNALCRSQHRTRKLPPGDALCGKGRHKQAAIAGLSGHLPIAHMVRPLSGDAPASPCFGLSKHVGPRLFRADRNRVRTRDYHASGFGTKQEDIAVQQVVGS
jgi:hypothetical protein